MMTKALPKQFVKPTPVSRAKPDSTLVAKPRTPSQSPRILIVDDHPLFRDAVKATLARGLSQAVCGEAQSAEAAHQMIRQERWDLVLMDVNMPGRSGLDILLDIKAACRGLPVLMMSGDFNSELAVRALRSGAAGFLTKTSYAEELLAAIKIVLGGGRYVSQELAEQIALAVGTGTGRPAHAALSNREREILCQIAAAKAPKEIAQLLGLSVKTVSTYRARILVKLKLKTTAEIMHYAIRHGLAKGNLEPG